MNKKVFVFGLVVLAIATFFFRLQLKEPLPFFSENDLIEELNSNGNYARVSEILDMVSIDERHVFVPFVLENGRYGFSAWEWNPSRKWEILAFHSVDGPSLWNIDNRSERYFVYNFPPDDKVTELHVYMIRDRNAWISYDVPAYLPRIQLEENISLGDKRYGVYKMPEEWVELNDRLSENETGRTDQLFSSLFSQHELMHYGWRTVGQNGEQRFIEQEENGFGSSYSGAVLFLSTLSDQDLEFGE